MARPYTKSVTTSLFGPGSRHINICKKSFSGPVHIGRDYRPRQTGGSLLPDILPISLALSSQVRIAVPIPTNIELLFIRISSSYPFNIGSLMFFILFCQSEDVFYLVLPVRRCFYLVLPVRRCFLSCFACQKGLFLSPKRKFYHFLFHLCFLLGL